MSQIFQLCLKRTLQGAQVLGGIPDFVQFVPFIQESHGSGTDCTEIMEDMNYEPQLSK